MYEIINIRDINLNQFDYFLNSNDSLKIQKYKLIDDKLRALASIILQKKYIYKNYPIVYKDIVIEYTKNGKPFYKDLYYNVSHDSDLTIIVYTTNKEIGVDIMKKKKIKISTFYNCFTFIERQYLTDDNFFIFWCVKEALVKAIGVGLEIKFNLIEFNVFTNSVTYDKRVYCVEFIDIPNYVCAVVTI